MTHNVAPAECTGKSTPPPPPPPPPKKKHPKILSKSQQNCVFTIIGKFDKMKAILCLLNLLLIILPIVKLRKFTVHEVL